MPFTLTPDNAVAYLVARRVIDEDAAARATAELLGGGVSNIVVRVAISAGPNGAPDGNPDVEHDVALVAKQSLPQLRVAQEWFADRQRIHREWGSIQYLAGVLPPTALPRVVYANEDDFLYVMTSAPTAGVNWKDALLAGQVDVAVAGKVGGLLATVHRTTAITGGNVPSRLQPFADQRCFVQLRIDPYHRATAAVHPELAHVIESEAQRMLNHPLALVHGDYSPKNVIVTGAGASAEVYLLDFEVAHLGHPAFDLAFMLNHLTLKAIHQPEITGKYNRAARAFWASYVAAVLRPAGYADVLELDTVRQLGVLLLARVDGKSPAEYITTDAAKARVRHLARSILTGESARLSHVHDWLLNLAHA